MFDFESADSSRSPRFTSRLFTLAVAFFFLMFGIEKLFGIGDWVRVFERIGFGQWFRYFTGAVQIAGAAFLVTLRTYFVGVLLLASTMIGAIIAQILILGSLGTAVIPGSMLLLILIAGGIEVIDHREREEIRRLTREFP